MSTDESSRYREGYSLPRDLFLDPERYQQDVQALKERLWLIAGHVSQVPRPGDYFIYEFDTENVIIVRGNDGQIRAHHNVCRHRGSRILFEREGNARRLSCAYHGWCFELDGRLRAAPHMPEGFDKEENGLVSCELRVFGGLIFIKFAGRTDDFNEFTQGFSRELEFNGIPQAKVVKRQTFRVEANWKLFAHNNYECYHCPVGHPTTFWQAHSILRRSPEEQQAFFEEIRSTDGEKARQCSRVIQDPIRPYYQMLIRWAYGKDRVTESPDGRPVSRLMGQAEYTGAYTVIRFSPLATVVLNADYAFVYNMAPRSPRVTDVEALWLVDGEAVEGVDFELSRLTALWHGTLSEDKKLAEGNQLGVESSAYRPGMYSTWEPYVSTFDRWYLTSLFKNASS